MLNSRLFTILITRYVLCWTSGGPELIGQLIVVLTMVGHQARGGVSTSRTGDSELVVGQCGATNIGFDQRLFDRMNQNESE